MKVMKVYRRIDRNLEKLLKGSEIYNYVNNNYFLVISPGLEPKIEIFNKIIYVYYPNFSIDKPRKLSYEAQAGLIIFELYYVLCKKIHSRCTHEEHIITAWKKSSRYEKKLIKTGLKEYFGERLIFRRDWKYYCKFFS